MTQKTCKTCKFFEENICKDTSKIIYDSNDKAMTSVPLVEENWSCSNHTEK